MASALRSIPVARGQRGEVSSSVSSYRLEDCKRKLMAAPRRQQPHTRASGRLSLRLRKQLRYRSDYVACRLALLDLVVKSLDI